MVEGAAILSKNISIRGWDSGHYCPIRKEFYKGTGTVMTTDDEGWATKGQTDLFLKYSCILDVRYFIS